MFNISNKDASSVADAPWLTTHGLAPTWVLALGTFAVGTDAFIVSAFLAQMARDLSVTPAVAGSAVTAFALAYALLAPVIATLTATVARRKLLIGSLVLLGLANMASAMAPTLGALIATRIAAAACAAAYTPNAGAVAAAIVRPDLRARALAVVIGGLTVATALGVPLGHVVSAAMSWRASLALVGLVAIVSAVAVFLLMPPVPGGKRITLRRRLAVLGRPGVLLILPLTILGMAACYVPYAFTLQVLEALGISAAASTFMLFAYGAGAFVGNLLSGYGTDRVGPTKVLAGTYLLMMFTLGMLAQLSRVPSAGMFFPIALLMACWGASSWAQSPAQQHRLIASVPDEAPLVVALNSSGIYFGISIGTSIGSRVIEQGAATLLVYGFILAGAALAYLAVTVARRRA